MSDRRLRELEQKLKFGRLLLAGGVAVALTALPVDIDSPSLSLDWQTALARKGGDDGGGSSGRGGGGDRDRGDRDRDDRGGHDHGDDDDDDGGRGYGDDDDDDDHGWSRGRGRGRGHDGNFGGLFDDDHRGGRHVVARERYHDALEDDEHRHGRGRGHGSGRGGGAEFEHGPGGNAHRYTPEETQALLEHGWQGRHGHEDGFRNHGERVRTMVELAKELGYGARVGALQANFGTPYENGIVNLQDELADARAKAEANPDNPEFAAEIERLESELDAAIEAAKPGNGPDDDRATADLDVIDDGGVDRRDLEALKQGTDDAADVRATDSRDQNG